MRNAKRSFGQSNPQRFERGDHGVALVTTLLLLTLLVAMTLSMTIAVTSDTLISRYYRNSRSSFYAADSGLNIARQYMISQLKTNASLAVGTTYSASSTPPLSSSDASTTQTNVLAAYGSSAAASNLQVNSGQGSSSWPGTFYLVSSQSGTVGTTLTGPSPTCQAPTYTGTPTNTGPYTCNNPPVCTGTCTGFSITYNYTYPYTITAIGQSLANEQQILQDSGNLIIAITSGTATATTTSFAAWGMFIDQYSLCDGSSLVPGTITGPVFTNGSWNFGTSGTYTFTDTVSSAGTQFGYQFGNCYGSNSPSYTSGGSTISPTFQSGYQLGANAVSLPTNSYSQEDAVLDGVGTTTPTQAAMHTDLRNEATTQYPSSGTPTSGVYMSYAQSGSPATNTMAGGGIYVAGNADSVVLSATTAPSTGTLSGTHSGDALQVFTITQGTTTTTITIDQTTNNTVMQQSGSSTPLVISGVPQIKTGATPSDATMLYVNGQISSLSGQATGADVQNNSAITITAANDITVTGNITYATEPVTMTQNQVVNGTTYPTADSLISGNNNGQVLGIFTAGGNVNLAVPTNNQNLEIDASIATISQGGSGAIINNGNSINTLNIVGGRIQNTIQNIGATTRNVFFDRRFSSGNFAPPWFPSTTVTPTASDSVNSITVTSATRTQWVDSSVQ